MAAPTAVTRWRQWPEDAPPRPARWAILGVAVVFAGAGVLHRNADPALPVTVAALATAGCAALTLFGPRLLLFPAALAGSAAVAVLADGSPSSLAFFAIPVFAAWCTLAAPLIAAAGYWLLSVLLFVGEIRWSVHDPGWGSWLAGVSFTVIACYLGRRQHALVLDLRDAQAGLAQRAQAEERNRIARELHDVIAHSLTVSLLHVSSARLAVADDPEHATRALAEAERLGRASLDEVRHAVGLLKRADATDPTAPLPGSTDVPTLVDGFRSAGADVSATVDGDLAALPATVGLATYRIVQEALTNAAKHAPRRRATVHVVVAADAVRIDVDSAGAPGHGSGLGLLGMRERAASLGGVCEAGPGGSGWRVHAELPLTTPSGPATPTTLSGPATT